MTQAPENMDSILRRCNKLLAVAEGNANENESAAAAAMVAKIMQKYRIENSDLYLAKFKEEDQFDTVTGEPITRLFKWMSYLSYSVSLLYGVKVTLVAVGRKNRRIVKALRFQGFKEDVQVAQWTLEYLSNTIINASAEYLRENPGVGLAATDSFRQGMSIKIQTRIKEYVQESKKEAVGTGRDLIIAKDAAVEEMFGKQKVRTSSASLTDQYAALAGASAGDKVDIFRRGLTASQSDSQLRLGN